MIPGESPIEPIQELRKEIRRFVFVMGGGELKIQWVTEA